MLTRSQRIFAHVTTVAMSRRVQNFVEIGTHFKHILNKSTANFGRIWNSIEILLVERVPGLFSLRGKTSYRKISWSLKAARLDVIMIVSFWKFPGISPRCLSNFRAIVGRGPEGSTMHPPPHPYKTMFFWTLRVSTIRNEMLTVKI